MRSWLAMGVCGGLFALLATAVAMRTRSPPPPPRGPVSPLEVEVSGCAAVRADGRCERPADGSLRLVVVAPPESVVVDGAGVDVRVHERVTLPDGVRLRIEVSAPGMLVVSAGDARAHVEVVAPPAWPWLPRARALREARDEAGLRALVADVLRGDDREAMGVAQSLLARTALARDDVDEAASTFRAAMAAHLASGRVSDAVEDAFALIYALTQRRAEYAAAAEVVAQAESLTTNYPDGVARLPYYRALVSAERGDLRQALADFARAAELADRLALARASWNARNSRALLLERLGRLDEAVDALTRLDADHGANVTACDRAYVRHNLAFGALLARQRAPSLCSQAGDAATAREADVDALLEAAERAHRDGCATPQDLAMIRVLRAESALVRRDHAAASALLEASRAEVQTPSAELARRWLDAEAGIALARGRAKDALATYDRLVAFARASARVADERRGHEGRGEALEALGATDSALEAYAQADALLDREIALVPFGEGRVLFAGGRDRAAQALVELLERQKRVEQARDVARRARGRVVAALASLDRRARLGAAERTRVDAILAAYREQRRRLDREALSDWRLPEDVLAKVVRERRVSLEKLNAAIDAIADTTVPLDPPRPLRADELRLTVHPTRSGYAVFQEDRTGLTGTLVPRTTNAAPGVFASALLAPAHDAIARAERVLFAIGGGLECVDLHAVDHQGRPLALAKIVAYATDVRAPPPLDASIATALIVGDPLGDLPRAREEAESLAAALRTEGIAPTLLVGRSADASSVIESLASGPTYFHYAGHGRGSALDGARSALSLAVGTGVDAVDVLALPRAPARVVLSACEAARRAEAGTVVGLGLADAIVRAGAHAVLAPTRNVSDELAARVADALVAERVFDAHVDPARALRDALAVVAARDSAADWKAYRAFEP
jgi:CHAT domain-containing protein